MNNQEQYYDNPGAICNSAPGTSLIQVPTLQSLAVNQPENRYVRKLERRADMAASQERVKARLAGEIIVNTTALSAFADQAIASVPSCEQPVRGIVNAYAQSSALRLAERW